MTRTTKSTQKVDAAMRNAYAQWLGGTPWTVLKKKLRRPIRATFTLLSGSASWKAARAQRDAQLKKKVGAP